MPRASRTEPTELEKAFAVAYVENGNRYRLRAYLKALERTGKTTQAKPHSIRARASELANNYRVSRFIQELNGKKIVVKS